MARISRWTQKIFASGASNNGIFGSGQDGTKILSNSLADIQSKAAWAAGWLSSIMGANKFPPLEEVQAIDYLVTTQLSYIFQEGIPEYDAGTTYYHYSVVKKTGTFMLYGSKTDANTGNPLTDTTNWQFLCDLSALTAGYLTAANNLSDVVNAATSLSNIGGMAKSANLSDIANLTTALTNLGFSKSFISPGYQKLPGGLIIQWGGVSNGGSASTTVTYPTAFPTETLVVVPGGQTSSYAAQLGMIDINYAVSATQFVWRNTSGAPLTNWWIAIGH